MKFIDIKKDNYRDIKIFGNVGKPDSMGITPLMKAAYYTSPEVARKLIDKGAKVNARDYHGRTPLYWAALSNTMNSADFLKERFVEKKGDCIKVWNLECSDIPDITYKILKDRKKYDDPSGYGVSREKIFKIMDLLLSAGADINLETHFNTTVAYEWVKSGFEEGVRYVFKNGYSPSERESYKLLYCVKDRELFELLIEKGIDPDARDRSESSADLGETALHDAAASGDTKKINWLLDAGAGIDKPAYWKYRPTFYAVGGGENKALELLLKRGADIKAKDRFGRTVYKLAKETDNGEARLIIKEEKKNVRS